MAKQEAKSETALAIPANLAGGLVVDGYADDTNPMGDVQLLHMHSGSNEDQAKFPDAKAGDWIDTLDGSNLGKSVRFLPLAAFMSYTGWEEGARRPTYSVNDKKLVPKGDLVWGTTGDMAKDRPKCVEAFNYVGLVNDLPYVFRVVFKRTAFKAGVNMMQLQQRRDVQGTGPGVYELHSVDDKNAKGQTYKLRKVKPVGNPTAEQLALAAKIAARLAATVEKAKDSAKNDESVDATTDEDCPV